MVFPIDYFQLPFFPLLTTDTEVFEIPRLTIIYLISWKIVFKHPRI